MHSDSAANEFSPTVPNSRPLRRSGMPSRPASPPPAPPTIPNPQRAAKVNAKAAARGSRPAAVAVSAPSHAEGFAKFRVGDELGRGGMGLVRAAEDVALHRELAIKVLLKNFSPAAVAQFVEEAQITGQLEHPNIVPVHELGLDRAGRPWLAMKRVTGKNLRQWIADRHAKINGRFDAEFIAAALGIFNKVCDAIAFAHSRGVVHRDLKPENIMVGEFGEVLVMDWGLAKPLAKPVAGARAEPHGAANGELRANGRPVVSDRRLGGEVGTMQGAVFGTPAYMAPEQAMGDTDAIAEPADIFALGGILYHLLTGHAPYAGADSTEVLHAAKNRDLIAPHKRAPQRGVPRELSAIVMKAMASVPANRYRSVAALQADLAAFETFRRSHAYRPGLIERVVKWTRRHPMVAMSGTLSLLFVAVLGVIGSLWLAEMQRAQFEADRRAIAEKDAADRKELLDAMQAGNYDHVLSLLQGEVYTGRDDAIKNIRLILRDIKQYVRDDQEWPVIEKEKLAEYLAAFEKLIDAHDRWGVEVTDDDYFRYAYLLSMGKGDHLSAIGNFCKAIELNPNRAVLFHNRGLCYAKTGDIPKAILDLSQAIELDKNYESAYINRGALRLRLNQFSLAISDFDQAIRINPSLYVAYLNRGNVKMETGDWQGALDDYTEAIKLNPNSATSYRGRGWIYETRMNHREAINEYSRAIEIDPSYAEAYARRSHEKTVIGDFRGALDDANRAIELAPELAVAYFSRGFAYSLINKRQDAITDYGRAIELDPRFAEAFCNRGIEKTRMGDIRGAMEDLERSHELSPHNTLCLYQLGELRLENGDAHGAIECFDQALQITPNLVAALVKRGIAKTQLKEFSAAIDDYDRAIEIYPDGGATYFYRGNAKHALGQFLEAIVDYERATNINHMDVKSFVNMASTRQALKDWEGALRDYDRAIEIDSGDWVAWAGRGQVLSRSNNSAAIESFQRAYSCCDLPEIKSRLAADIRRLGGTVHADE